LTTGVRRFHAIESAKDRCVWRAKPRARDRSRALSGYPSRHDLALPAAAAPNAPAKLFQQHFKDLTFNARQALAVKFER
jgi:hypothetical protein